VNVNVVAPTPLVSRRPSRLFHTGIALALLVTALAGFAPTYFLKAYYHAPLLSPILHLHGVVFTAWLVLLLAQSALVASHRVDLHKRLGIAAAMLAVIMMPVGTMTAIDGARRGVAVAGMTPLAFMVFPIGALMMFAGFVGAALWYRRRPEIHRRLVLLGTVSIITPAIARLPGIDHNPVKALLLSTVFVMAAMIHDWKVRGRVHPIYIFGVLFIPLSGPIRAAIGQTVAWQSFAQLLVG
ncbi:MAG: hypothetical protein ABIV50_00275, partial [Opitutus sp.]